MGLVIRATRAKEKKKKQSNEELKKKKEKKILPMPTSPGQA